MTGQKKFTIPVVLLLVFYIQYALWNRSPLGSMVYKQKEPHIFPSNPLSKNKTLSVRTKKTILLWTRFFREYNDWFGFYGQPPKSCSATCHFTFNQTNLGIADAVMMHASNLYFNEKDLPQSRSPNQAWILHNTECPTKTQLDMSHFNNLFNWTSMVRGDSDVPVYYGRTVPGKENDNVEIIKNSLFENKTLGVAWAASNCYSSNGREEYVRALQEFIDVDIFGGCGDKKCPGHWNNAEKCLSKYKFYLAFENSNCRDYITEKLWRTYTIGSIPIVRGGANYNKMAPPGSFINTADFPTPKDLADHLKKVGGDRDLFDSYMRWHETHRLQLADGQYWCDLCEAVQSRSGQRQVYQDLAGWFGQDTCHHHWMPYSVQSFLKPLMRGEANTGIYR